MLPELTQNDFATVLDGVARDLLDQLDLSAPPVDALCVAQALGLAVAWDAGSRAGEKSCGCAGMGRRRRKARFCCGLIRAASGCSGPSRTRSARRGPGRCSIAWRSIRAKRRRRPASRWPITSPAGCCCRATGSSGRAAAGLGPVGARAALRHGQPRADRPADARLRHPITITIFDHGRRTFRRGNFGRPVAPLTAVEQIAWLAAHDRGGAAEESNHVCRAQAWPIHEPDWKREILRTEWFAPDDDWDAAE